MISCQRKVNGGFLSDYQVRDRGGQGVQVCHLFTNDTLDFFVRPLKIK